MSGHTRIGTGIDAHRFGGDAPLVLCGVVIPGAPGVEATSDGDVAAHALADALLGAAALGDLGTHFPSSDERWVDASSTEILSEVVELCRGEGLVPGNVDVTIVAESVRVSGHRDAMRKTLAGVLGLDIELVSVKATSTDGLGFVGRDEGVLALAAATLYPE